MKDKLAFFNKPIFIAIVALVAGVLIGSQFRMFGRTLGRDFDNGKNFADNQDFRSQQMGQGISGQSQSFKGNKNDCSSMDRPIDGSGRENGRGNGPLIGQVVSYDDKSITIKISDDTTKTVTLGSDTKIYKDVEASKTHLIIGTTISVFSINNDDGTSVVSSVLINPALQGQQSKE